MHEDSSGHGLESEIGIGDEGNVIDLGDQLGGWVCVVGICGLWFGGVFSHYDIMTKEKRGGV
jgi:hypothetical protein